MTLVEKLACPVASVQGSSTAGIQQLNKKLKHTSYEVQSSSSYEGMVGVRGEGGYTPGYVNHNKSGHMEYAHF